jgi:3-hydroxyisobutyrate dehydrogenase
MKIGFIGAGRMGRPMVDHLVADGHAVTVLARTEERQAEAARDGLVAAATVTDTARDAEVVFVVVLKDADVRSVSLGPEGALAAMAPGSALVIHTTSDPETSTIIAAEAQGRGIRVLDAALSGGPQDIAEGHLTLWIGGDETLLEELRPLLALYASPIMPVGPLGNGQRTKLVNNALFVAQIGLAVDAVRLAGSIGIDSAAILAAVQHGSGSSRALSIVSHAPVPEQIGDMLGDLMSKDVAVVREVAARMGADLGIIGEVLSSRVVQETVLRNHSPEANS